MKPLPGQPSAPGDYATYVCPLCLKIVGQGFYGPGVMIFGRVCATSSCFASKARPAGRGDDLMAHFRTKPKEFQAWQFDGSTFVSAELFCKRLADEIRKVVPAGKMWLINIVRPKVRQEFFSLWIMLPDQPVLGVLILLHGEHLSYSPTGQARTHTRDEFKALRRECERPFGEATARGRVAPGPSGGKRAE